MQNHEITNPAAAWFCRTKLFLDIISLVLALSFFGIHLYMHLSQQPVSIAMCLLSLTVMLPLGLLCDYFSAKLDCSVGAHRCKHCGHVHMPAKNHYMTYLGFGSKRYLTCPECGKNSWHKKVLED